MRLPLAVRICLAALILGACQAPRALTSQQTQAVNALSDALCQHFASCEGPEVATGYQLCRRSGWWISPPVVIPATPTTPEIVEVNSAIDTPSQVAAAILSGAVQMTPGDVSACVSEIESSACGVTFSLKQMPSCVAAFRGKVADGAPCETSLACGASSFCRRTAPGCGASCQPGSGTCVTDDDCPSDEFCSGQEICLKSTGTAPGLGEPCGQTSRCAPGLFCPEVFLGGNPVCTARVPEGQACSVTQRCQSGLYCDPSGTCQKQAALGQPCDAGAFLDATSACAQGACLLKPGASGTGVCVQPFQPEGAACSFIGQCASLLHCDATTGTCVANPSSGPCAMASAIVPATANTPEVVISSGLCDPSSFCDTSDANHPVCRPILTAGAACSSDLQCDESDHEICGPASGFSTTMGVCHVPSQAALCQAQE